MALLIQSSKPADFIQIIEPVTIWDKCTWLNPKSGYIKIYINNKWENAFKLY